MQGIAHTYYQPIHTEIGTLAENICQGTVLVNGVDWLSVTDNFNVRKVSELFYMISREDVRKQTMEALSAAYNYELACGGNLSLSFDEWKKRVSSAFNYKLQLDSIAMNPPIPHASGKVTILLSDYNRLDSDARKSVVLEEEVDHLKKEIDALKADWEFKRERADELYYALQNTVQNCKPEQFQLLCKHIVCIDGMSDCLREINKGLRGVQKYDYNILLMINIAGIMLKERVIDCSATQIYGSLCEGDKSDRTKYVMYYKKSNIDYKLLNPYHEGRITELIKQAINGNLKEIFPKEYRS